MAPAAPQQRFDSSEIEYLELLCALHHSFQAPRRGTGDVKQRPGHRGGNDSLSQLQIGLLERRRVMDPERLPARPPPGHGHVYDLWELPAEAPKPGRREMTQSRFATAREHGCQRAPMRRQAPLPHRIHPSVEPMQPLRPQEAVDRGFRAAELP
jgi:hypothetical protein